MKVISFTFGVWLLAAFSVLGESSTNSVPIPVGTKLERRAPALREEADVQVHEQTNRSIASAERTDQVRNDCIKGRRVICGKVIKVLPEGLVVDSGYTALTKSPFNQSWVVDSGASVKRDSNAFEVNEPGAACVGIVFLTHFPKRPSVKLYDYVVIQGYPVGQHTYTSVPGVQKTVRKFSAGLDTAIKMNLAAEQK